MTCDPVANKSVSFSLFQVIIPESESVWLENSGRVGVTLESHVGIISLKYVNGRNMIFRDIFNPESGGDDFPKVGTSYQFNSPFLPAVWSIGVVIRKGKLRKRNRHQIFLLM